MNRRGALEFLKRMQPITIDPMSKDLVGDIIGYRVRSEASDLATYTRDAMRTEILSRGVTWGIDYGK